MNDSPAEPDPRPTTSLALQIQTACRLHFGLLDTVAPFGGVGVMVDEPRTEVLIQPHPMFCCDGPDASRLSEIARRIAQLAGRTELPSCKITVGSRPPAHYGLGSGTQLALAAAEALCRFCHIDVPTEQLACELAGRGKRSAVGIHGYFHGGLIYEAACESESLSSLNAVRNRVELPETWRAVVYRPRPSAELVCGNVEQNQFATLPPADPHARRELVRIAEEQLIPSARAGQFDAFTDAVTQFNLASGKLFEPVQGSAYNGATVTSLVQSLMDHGAVGVGQSSWGPSVFAWFESEQDVERFIDTFPNDTESKMVKPANHGRVCSK